MSRLVIPATAKPTDTAWPDSDRKETWAEIAAENGVDIAVQGDTWCIDNRFPVDALGIGSEYVAPPPPPPPPPPESKLPIMSQALIDAAEANVDTLAVKLDSALDPSKTDPTTSIRLQTLEQTIALIIQRLEG